MCITAGPSEERTGGSWWHICAVGWLWRRPTCRSRVGDRRRGLTPSGWRR